MTDRVAGIDVHEQELLRILLQSRTPVSGRRVAEVLGVSPTTANKRLKALLERGLVNAEPAGVAVLWSASDANASVRALRRDLESGTPATSDHARVPADSSAWQQPVPGSRLVLKAVVLTALALEYAAVRSHLAEITKRRTRSGTRYEVGYVRGEYLDWEVYLAEIGMGNVGGAAEVAAAAETFSPHLILFVGVAGGLKPDDQSHGDVVVASMVYNVHSAKLAPGPDGGTDIQSRPLGVQASHRLTQLVKEIARTKWAIGPLGGNQVQRTSAAQPAVHVRPIVAGEVVLADPDSELRKHIAQHFSDAAAIDMESYGVYETAHRYELPVLAVRGLSDLIGDKDPGADRERQPQAAANAAAFAVSLLSHADEEGLFPGRSQGGAPGGGNPSNPAVPSEKHGVASADESLARLAPSLRPWWRRLRVSRGSAADAAIAELAQRSASPTGWLNRLRYRPPEWLRNDDRGDAWALVAWFAESHGSEQATWLYDEAARRAGLAGEETVANLHRLQAALVAARHVPGSGEQQEGSGPDDGAGRTEVLRRLSEASLHDLGPLTTMFQSMVKDDIDGVLASVPAVMQILGLSPERFRGLAEFSGDLSPADHGVVAAAAIEELTETDPDLVDQLRGDLALRIGFALLARSELDAALAAFREAGILIPAAAAPLLWMARTRLRRAGDPGRLPDSAVEVSSELREAEEQALLARDRLRAWNGSSGEAVAIAVRARSIGDPRGALRLALPAPRGIATDAEAQDPQVREAGAVAALQAGEFLLATELASGISDPVERDLVRAAALAKMPPGGDEAEQALRRALQAAPVGRPDQLVRALLGLVQMGAPISRDLPGTVAPELARLRDVDSEAADLVEASAALRSGQVQRALVLARQYPASAAAVEIAAQAAAEAGDREGAFRILDRAGRERGDESLRTQAMFLAADSGLDDEAQQVAAQLVLSNDAETRRHALETQLTLAGRAARWVDVADLGRRLLGDEVLDLSDGRREQHVVDYKWAVAGAEFNLRRPQRAWTVLGEPEMLKPRNPLEASLQLTVLRIMATSPGPGGTPSPFTVTPEMLAHVFDVAAAFPDEEGVVASALKMVMMQPGSESMPDGLLAQSRALQEEFFSRFPDSAHLRRITLGDDLSNLADYLQATFAPAAEQLTDLSRNVWLGLYPQGLLADVTNRSYAEILIKRMLGCLVASADDSALADVEQAAAHDARGAGSLVIDTSTLVMLDHISRRSAILTAQFARILLPASHRDDILEARNSLALRSTSTLGWNDQQQRPQLTEFTPEVVEKWARSGDQLAQRLVSVEVVPGGKAGWSWDDTLLLASREGVALWADDLALRQAARSLKVPAFGTLDLVSDLVNDGHLRPAVLDEVVAAFRDAYVVDLPLGDQLQALAASEGWKPEGYAALLLARPRFWSQTADGFARLTHLIRALPRTQANPETVAAWLAAAMTGLAWAIPPAARPRALAGLVAWSVLSAGGAEIFPKVLDAGENVMAVAAPAGDLLAETVSVLSETLGSIVPTDQVGVVFTRLLADFDQERRARAIQSFFSVPRDRTNKP